MLPGGLILGYHRIADDAWDPLGLGTKLQHFEQHLAFLNEYLRPVPLRELVDVLRRGGTTTGMVAVTFDDGYRDLIDHALPALEAADTAATVFVTTGNAGQPFWWDEVSNCLRRAGPDKPTIKLTLSDVETPHEYGRIDNEAAAAQAAKAICRDFLNCSPTERSAALEQLRAWADPVDSWNSMPQALSDPDIRRIHETAGIEIASHTVSHPMLEHLPLAQQREEIERSRLTLEAVTGRGSVTGFSYPNGSFSTKTLRLVQELGFDYACTSRQGVVRNHTDPFRLPRVWAPDFGRNRFRRWLSSWCGKRF